MGWFDWLGDKLQTRNGSPNLLRLSSDAQEKLCKALRVDTVSSVQVRMRFTCATSIFSSLASAEEQALCRIF